MLALLQNAYACWRWALGSLQFLLELGNTIGNWVRWCLRSEHVSKYPWFFYPTGLQGFGMVLKIHTE